MDGAAEEILLQKLEELILDEDNIMTVSAASEKLDISLDEAKYIMEKFVSDQLKSSKELSITYLLSGVLKNGGMCIHIVDGMLLNDKKKSYETLFSKTVYSVQKRNNIDLNLIALSEKANTDDSRISALKGSIVSEKCTERVIKMKILPPLPPQKNFEKQKPSSFFKPSTKSQSNENSGKVKLDNKSPKKESEKLTQNKTENDMSKEENTKVDSKKLGGIASFLSQSKKGENIKQSTATTTEEVPSCKKMKTDSQDVKREIKENSSENESTSKQTNMKNSITNDKSKKSTQNEKKKSSDSKKRKRIIVDSDSEDDIFGKDVDEKMKVLESDEEKPAIQPKSSPCPVPKNKRRKAVEKTYEDEEGYVVTKTEYILVSASEDEEERVEKIEEKTIKEKEHSDSKDIKEVQAKSKAKKGKTLAANQTTLMSFFKKK